jgi:uncharacterized metal-binding protein YceD (DUF177 family)
MGKFQTFKLPLKSLSHGEHLFNYHLDKQFFTNMENTDIHGADLEVKLTLNYKGDVYDLDFSISGEIVLLCDRCLDELHQPVNAGYHIIVKYGDKYCDDSDEVLEIPDTENYLNVAYMIYDTVVLAIPIKHVHPHGQCNKVMSDIMRKHRALVADEEDADLMEELIEEMEDGDTAANAPTDPRWDALKGLASNGIDD